MNDIREGEGGKAQPVNLFWSFFPFSVGKTTPSASKFEGKWFGGEEPEGADALIARELAKCRERDDATLSEFPPDNVSMVRVWNRLRCTEGDYTHTHTHTHTPGWDQLPLSQGNSNPAIHRLHTRFVLDEHEQGPVCATPFTSLHPHCTHARARAFFTSPPPLLLLPHHHAAGTPTTSKTRPITVSATSAKTIPPAGRPSGTTTCAAPQRRRPTSKKCQNLVTLTWPGSGESRTGARMLFYFLFWFSFLLCVALIMWCGSGKQEDSHGRGRELNYFDTHTHTQLPPQLPAYEEVHPRCVRILPLRRVPRQVRPRRQW